MKQHRPWPRFAIVLAVLALIATGCRDSGTTADVEDVDTGAAPAETTTPADTATDTPTETAADTATPTDTGSPTEGTTPAGDIAFDTGVTEEACPDAVNPDNGCIYLGTLSDLTVGPFAALAVPITDAQQAFWNRVNEDGGIGGFDVNVTEFVRDNQYNPEIHNQEYQAIKNDVLALAQTLGSPTTAAIIEDLNAEGIVAVPASWTSEWAFQDVILESGVNYCFESMNSIDWAVENLEGIETVMAVHYPGDYGGDAAAGARIAAEANGLEFTDVETAPGPDNQSGAISAVASQQPDLVILTTNPTDAGAVVGNTAAQGYQGTFIGTGPSWNKGLLTSPAAEAVQALYLASGPWTWTQESPGRDAMEEALGDVDPNDGYTSGWVWSYPLKAALERAAENGDLTREGLLAAVSELDDVDYEGMLPDEAGNFVGDPNETAYRGSIVSEPNPEAIVGLDVLQDFFVGPTAEGYDFTQSCFTTTAG